MELAFSLMQALELAGLAPSLFLVAYLAALAPKNRLALIPAGYFAALACSFALPLMPLVSQSSAAAGGLMFGESALAAFGFLLVVQFLTGRLPSAPYWLVLAVPLIGGSVLTYASLVRAGETGAASIRELYTIFSSALLFLLLVYYSSRMEAAADLPRRHTYWLIIALILLHLFVLALGLAKMAGELTPQAADLSAALLKLTFIYLVITSLFRVFTPVIDVPLARRPHDPALDAPHVEKLKALLEVERVWREMRLNRAALAQKVGIGEHQLSRIINQHFKKNFNDLINGYRIEEAKRRLKSEPTPITTIAFETGFNSIASFNRVFKARVGVSPTEFRDS